AATVLGTAVPAALSSRSAGERPRARTRSVPVGRADPPGIRVQPGCALAKKCLRAHPGATRDRPDLRAARGRDALYEPRAVPAGDELADRRHHLSNDARRA